VIDFIMLAVSIFAVASFGVLFIKDGDNHP
jgi:hypothetical protein